MLLVSLTTKAQDKQDLDQENNQSEESVQNQNKNPEKPFTVKSNFSSDIEQLFRRTAKEVIISEGQQLGNSFESLSPKNQDTLLAILKYATNKKIRVNPTLYHLSIAINGALAQGFGTSKITDLLSVSDKTLKNRDNKEIGIYFKTISTFFTESALFYSKYNTLLIEPSSVSFEYIAYEPPPMEEIEPEEETTEDKEGTFDSWDEDDDSGWDDSDDGWGDDDDSSDDGWGDDDTNLEDEDENIEEDPLDTSTPFYLDEPNLPPLDGPVMHFESDMTMITPHDSITIESVKGTLMLHNRTIVAEGGKMDWQSVGLSRDSVYAVLGKYSFQADKPSFECSIATLTYKGKLNADIQGAFEFKSQKRKDSLSARYPRFMSFESNIQVNIDPNNQLQYVGGFSLEGRKISSSSVVSPLSKISTAPINGRYFKAVSPRFYLEDSLIYSKTAKVTIHLEGDSLAHPSRRLRYEYNPKILTLQKTEGRYKESPYYANYFDVNINSDMLKWQLEADSLDIQTLEARSQIPSFVESNEFFIDSRFDELTSFYKFNPLLLVVGYARKINNGQYNIDDLSRFAKQKVERVESAMILLADLSFIKYERQTGEIKLLRKAYHYVLSKQKRKDYDNLLISSLTDENTNITYRFTDKRLVIRGVDRFYLSKVLDVYILPRENEIEMERNRDFKFNGTVFAGNFEYNGSDFNFNYDQFLIEMNQIDSIQFYTQEKMPDGTLRRKKVDNKLMGATGIQSSDSTGVVANIDSTGVSQNTQKPKATTGTLYINESKNKSGRKIYPRYPWFNTDSETIVYFDDKKVLNNAYKNKSVYFVVPSFKLDSLGDNSNAQMSFNGTFVTSGLLPDFKERLVVMPDNSMGFNHNTPLDGYAIKGDKGKFYNRLSMDSRGLRGEGRIEHLSMELTSDDFIFYPDSITTEADSQVVMDTEVNDKHQFPDFKVDGYRMNWKVETDEMELFSKDTPFSFYNGTSTLEGMVNVTPERVFGAGLFKTNGSITRSKNLSFTNDLFDAKNAEFVINSSNPAKPALHADNVAIEFNLKDRKASISPEVAGDAALDFPYAQVKTSIPNAEWNLKDNIVRMRKSEDSDISQSYFYTTRRELDSLAFNAEFAEYDINALRLNVGGIPFIKVADAKITPEGGAMTILENAKLEVLRNARIKIDTLNGYHNLTDGNIEIISRNKFQGDAEYQLVTLSDTFSIKFDRFELKEFPDETSRRKNATALHTVSQGTIPESDNAIISPRFYYKGDVIMRADRKALELDGFVKMDLLNNQADFWIRFNRTADTTSVVLKYDDIITEEGTRLQTGLFYDVDDRKMIFKFLDADPLFDVHPVIVPSGYLSYDETFDRFRIEDQGKTDGTSFEGSVFSSDEKTTDFQFEGPVDFSGGYNNFPLQAACIASGNGNESLFELSTFLLFSPKVPAIVMDIMSEEIAELSEGLSLESSHGISKNVLYKVANIIGDKATKQYEEVNNEDYEPLVDFSPILAKGFGFSNVSLKWSKDNQAFYSLGSTLGVSNLGRNDINAKLEGFLEIKYDEEEGAILEYLFKAGSAWYHFRFVGNRLMIMSNNAELIEYVQDKSNAAKAKPGDFVWELGTQEDAQDFADGFRSTYYNKDDVYLLSAPMLESGSTGEEDITGGRRSRRNRTNGDGNDIAPSNDQPEIIQDNTDESLDESEPFADETPNPNAKKEVEDSTVKKDKGTDKTEDKKKEESATDKKKSDDSSDKKSKKKKDKKSKKKKETPPKKEDKKPAEEEDEDDEGF